MKQYRKRIYDTVLRHRLEAKGAVLVEGPKWCGKTTTCLQLAQSVLYMAQPDIREQNIMLTDMQPSLLLQGATPRLIDEWQIAPKLWDAVRFEADQRDEFNQFLLTGSSVPPSFTDITHTGTGRKIFVLEDMPAWNPNLRSKSAIRTSDTRHFVDPSIAAAALGIGPAGLIKDLETFGLLFESMCVRDFRVYADALDGDVFHFRDRTGLECDAVLHLRDGRYGLIEVKLGGNRLIEEGAANLIKLADKIDTTTMSKPSFLMVATGTGEYSFTRRDGVMVAPIRTLRP